MSTKKTQSDNPLEKIRNSRPYIDLFRAYSLVETGKFKVPKNYCNIDITRLVKLLLQAISLTPHEKIGLLLRLPDFTKTEIENLLSIFKREQLPTKDLVIEDAEDKNKAEIEMILNRIKEQRSLDILVNHPEKYGL